MALTFPAYTYIWGYSQDKYLAKFNDLFNQKYRMIDICVSGDFPNEQYAGIWVKQEPYPDYRVYNRMTPTAFQDTYSQLRQQAFTLLCLSASGQTSNVRFAGIWEKLPTSSQATLTRPGDFVLLDVPQSRLQQNIDEMAGSGTTLKMISQYGSGTDVHFALLFKTSKDLSKTLNWRASADSYMNAIISAQQQMVYYSPVSIRMIQLNNQWMFSFLSSDTWNGKWEVRYNLQRQEDISQYLNEAKTRNLFPISLQKTGDQFTVIVAEFWPSPARRFAEARDPIGPLTDAAAVGGSLDLLFEKFMEVNNVRHAQIAVGRYDGASNRTNYLYSKAYSWTEPGRYTVSSVDKFLLASVSKAFCCAAINAVYKGQGVLPGKSVNTDTKAYTYLGYSSPHDPRLANITVQQLVDHRGGYDRDRSGDPVFMARQISIEQSGGSRPITIKDMIDYMFKRSLDFDPGTDYKYSNYGYVILSAIVEAASGKSYLDYLQQYVLTPIQIIPGSVYLWKTSYDAHKNDPLVQDHAGTGPSSLTPLSDLPVPNVYGGDNLVKESVIGPSSLAANARTLVQFIGRNAAWGIGGRSAGSARSGSMDGSSTWISSMGNGIDFAIVMNTREFLDGNRFDNLASQVTNILSNQ